MYMDDSVRKKRDRPAKGTNEVFLFYLILFSSFYHMLCSSYAGQNDVTNLFLLWIIFCSSSIILLRINFST
jgi:hypothetical protein